MVQKLLKLLQTNFVLILICLLFLVTRIYKISEIPASVYWDEASIGYNAFSVLTTGKDEWGETLPLHFRAFGEFKLPVYVYSVLVTESAFGLTVLAVRLPSVIFGLLSVVGLYFVVHKLTNQKMISLLSSFLFSITPWFFIFSRTGYEAVAGLAFFIWAIYFLINAYAESKYLIFSTIFFIGSIYSYNSFRILAPIVLGISFLYLLMKRKAAVVFISTILLLVSIFPLYKLYKEDSGLSRLQSVGSKKNIVTNYIKNFSPKYLFIAGDSNMRSQMPNTGQLYYIDALFLILGVLYILKSKDLKLYSVFGLLLISVIPAAITKENPHALRAILMSPLLSIISAMGVYSVSKINKYLMFVIIGIYFIFFGNYFYIFINNYNELSKSDWQYKYKEIFDKQKSGCVSDEFAQPYIFALYYNKINPNDFISSRVLNPVSDWGFSTVAHFGNYNFPKKCE